MTTFRYSTAWKVWTKAGKVYRVVTDSNGSRALGDSRAAALNTFPGFGESVSYDEFLFTTRYVNDSRLQLQVPLHVVSVTER